MRYILRARRGRREEGIALLITVVIMLIMTLLLTVVFSVGVQSLPLARQAQNYQAALQAAQAGVQDYVNRLDNNTNYYQQSSDPGNDALENGSTWTTWAPVSGGGTNEWFRYSVNNQYAARTGVVYLQVSGAAGQYPKPGNSYAVRTVQVSLQLSGFTNFLYFTDYEIEDPGLVKCFNESSYSCQQGSANGADTYTNSCVWHEWAYNTYWNAHHPNQGPNGGPVYGPAPVCGTSGSYPGCSYSTSYPLSDCHIYFTSMDTLNGKVFSNDELNVCGGATFTGQVETAYNQSSNLDSSGSTAYSWNGPYHPSSSACGSPVFKYSGTQPAGAGYEQFPATNTNMESDLAVSNAGGGCEYFGPVVITFEPDGKMIAYSGPTGTASVPSGGAYSCTSPQVNGVYQEIPLPPNGLLYDANETACAPSCSAGTYADAAVSGTVGTASADAQVTVGSQYDVTVTGNLVDYSTSGSDIIGLSAQHSILLPHNNSDLKIDAAMVALNDSVYLPNWDSVGPQGTFYLNGSMAQEFRGPVGTFTTGWDGQTQLASGYQKAYSYDSRLQYMQPPYFTSPVLPNWQQSSFTECTSNPTPVPPVVGVATTKC